MEKPGTFYTKNWDKYQTLWNSRSFQMELNAVQKKSAKTMAMQNAGMLFFLL